MSAGVALSTAHALNAARNTGGGVQRHTRRCVPYLLLWSLTALVVTPCMPDAVRGVALYALRPIAIMLAFVRLDRPVVGARAAGAQTAQVSGALLLRRVALLPRAQAVRRREHQAILYLRHERSLHLAAY